MEAGGIYVTTYWSGVVNETDLCFIGERPHERLLGLSVDEIDVGNEYFPNTFSYKDGVYKAGVLREVVTLQTAKPLGTYSSNYRKCVWQRKSLLCCCSTRSGIFERIFGRCN